MSRVSNTYIHTYIHTYTYTHTYIVLLIYWLIPRGLFGVNVTVMILNTESYKHEK